MKTNNKRIKHILQYSIAAALITITALVPSAPQAVSAAPAEDTHSAQPQAEKTKQLSRVAIIVDDFGNGMRGTEEMFKLPVKITVAVMPFLRSSEQDARRAHELGYDVLVHLPMEPRQGKPEWLGPGGRADQHE
ncbi:divergent polysaccharide deacetylase family protein [Paenibacillus rhizoplanae]